MCNKTLNKLTVKRNNHVESCKANNDRSHQIIAESYSDPSHFIYEILQNADDAEATKIHFILTSQYLKVIHNGTKEFDYDDIESITTIGYSTKTSNVNAIGKFGVGFKSVFAVTSTPKIHSEEYHFEIRDFIVPYEIDPIEIQDKTTIFIFPFNHEELDASTAYDQIRSKLHTLESESLLFLRNLKEILWSSKEDKGHYIANISAHSQNTKEVHIRSQRNDDEQQQEYLLLQKGIEIESFKCRVAIAFAVDHHETNDKKFISPIQNAKLSVFFPTTERTGLKFLVHAPYKTTPNRETIPFDDEQNIMLSKALSDLTSESLSKLKELGYLDVGFLNILPIDKNETHSLYSEIYKGIKSKLLSNEALLPTADGQYAQANQAILARGKELVKLLQSEDLKILFGKKCWLNTKITKDRTPILRGFLLSDLNIKEVGYEDFAEEISIDFIRHKADSWMIEFYDYIYSKQELYSKKTKLWEKPGILRSKPIMRLDDNSHIAPFDETDNLQVYLPSQNKSSFKTVKSVFVDNVMSKEFLIKLGLKEPDKVAEIREFIAPKYRTKEPNISDIEYFNDLQQIVEIWEKCTPEEKREIRNILGKLNIIKANNLHGRTSYKKPHQVYLPTSSLRKWFDQNDLDDIYFFENALLQEIEDLKSFLTDIGVHNRPRLSGVNEYGGIGEWFTIRSCYARGLKRFNPEFMVEGLKFALKRDNINFDRSLYIFKIALENVGKIKGIVEESSRQDFKGGSHQEKKKEFSKAGRLLIKNQWLYDKTCNLIEEPYSKITLDNLHDNYETDHEDIDKFVKVLGLKLDEIKDIEEKTGGKFLTKEEAEEYEELKQKQKKQDEDKISQDSWEPECSPDEPSIGIDEQIPEPIESPDLSGQIPRDPTDRANGKNSNEIKETDDRSTKSSQVKHSKEIGEWGEKYAKRYLQHIYSQDTHQVIWLNENGDVGKGYDFVIRDLCNEDITYYEVKAKVKEVPELIEITGTQWEWARKLYDERNGEKYVILVVLNTGTSNPKIIPYQNPIKLWKEGKIKARPVYLEL